MPVIVTPVIRIMTAFAPLLLTPVLGWAINNGTLNFGGGEKDVILLVPWLVWAIGFATAALVYWWRQAGLGPVALAGRCVGHGGPDVRGLGVCASRARKRGTAPF
jgi:hypothetical protein